MQCLCMKTSVDLLGKCVTYVASCVCLVTSPQCVCLQGQGMAEFVKELRLSFQKVLHARPQAVRAESREVYIVALGRQ